jgi:hypothetical protein
MLDTYTYSSPSTNYVPFEKTVTEKKAPTDDSIRLYGEFLEKAREAIVDSFVVRNTHLDASITIFNDHICRNKVVCYKVVFNEEPIIGKITLPYNYSDRREAVISVVEAISKDLTKKLLDVIVPEVINNYK